MRDILTVENPEIVKGWDYEKNGDLCPEDFTGGSRQYIWWKCKLGHSWRSKISNRFILGRGCPYCKGRKVLAGFNDLSTTSPQVAANWDYEKNGALRPEHVTAGSNKKVWWKCDRHGYRWQAQINSRKLGGCPCCNNANMLFPGFNDLLTRNPGLAKEWDYEKNAPLRPENVARSAGRKMIWWRCEKGHSWQATVNCRDNQDVGCPYCTNQKVLKGFNDLLSVDPSLCEEWDYEKNAPLRPDEVTKNSPAKVWWKCKRGHRWRACIATRHMGVDCPYCNGKTPMRTRLVR